MRKETAATILITILLTLLVACSSEPAGTPPPPAIVLPAVVAEPTPAPEQKRPVTPIANPIGKVTPTRQPTWTPTAEPTPETGYYVAPEGNDEQGEGTESQPWASITQAVENVPDGSTIIVRPGVYHEAVSLARQFEAGITIQAAEPYRTRLEYDDTVVTCYTCAGIALEGFEIAHDGEGAERYVIQIQDLEGEGKGGQRVTLRNNVIHDSRNNDLVKVNNGAGEIVISGNIFYNMGGPHRDSHLDINSATDVTVEDNIFFNDFAASNRDNDHDTGSFVVVKDSNADDDRNLGSHRITLRRNIFLNWQGDDHNTFIVVGEDAVDYFQATEVLIENNLMLGNATEDMMEAAFQLRGSRDIVFRNNTIAGDLPARAFALRLSRSDNNPRNERVAFYNNIWSDPTGSMGAEEEDAGRLVDADPDDTESVTLANNLYWNAGNAIPADEDALVNYAGDNAAIVADPGLGRQEQISLPIWQIDEARFADGSTSIRQAFEQLVTQYGTPDPESAAVDAASAAHAPADDILGNSRPAGQAPDIGAVELE